MAAANRATASSNSNHGFFFIRAITNDLVDPIGEPLDRIMRRPIGVRHIVSFLVLNSALSDSPIELIASAT
jgi:hypothetical protein